MIDLEEIRNAIDTFARISESHTRALLAEVEHLRSGILSEGLAGHRSTILPEPDPPQAEVASRLSRWISVEERLPEPDQWFVGIRVERHRNLSRGVTETVVVMLRGYPNSTHSMTHWMPLPGPPEVK